MGHPARLGGTAGDGGAVHAVREDRKPNDHDWVYIAGGALLGGFTAHVWYPGFGPVFDGLNLIQALVGGLVGGMVVELVYRVFPQAAHAA